VSSETCEHWSATSCSVVHDLVGIHHPPTSKQCARCHQSDNPRSPNKVTASVAWSLAKSSGKDVSPEVVSIARDQPVGGAGTELHKIFSWFGFKQTDDCDCQDNAKKMDAWGADECERRIDTIVKWVEAEARSRSIPVNRVLTLTITTAVKVAIKRARKKEASFNQDFAIEIERINQEASDYEKYGSTLTTAENNRLAEEWPFVWTYWSGGAEGDELKYSIRSVLANQPNAQVAIVGDRPSWYAGRMLEKPRLSRRPHHAFKDCYSKLQYASYYFENFIWMMDDVYWINPFHMAVAIEPKYVRHVWPDRFNRWKPSNKWGRTRQLAYEWLLDNNRPTYDFASHLPQPVYSDSFQQMEHDHGLLKNYRNWECIYYNTYLSAKGSDWGRKTCRIASKDKAINKSRPILNHISSKYDGEVSTFLRDMYPSKSKVER